MEFLCENTAGELPAPTADGPAITQDTARHVLWMYDRVGGAQPGSCTEHLIRAIQSADVLHGAKLRQVFPELSAAIHLARYDEEGISKLQALAAGVRA
ncbi:hypothetical protein [Streptomyces sp. NPDC056242]|uniref:hypothetical protein n=1 Tax=Streptomyces sp. NPDC056242 TaxID=3345760 RepID=UPI0035DCA424